MVARVKQPQAFGVADADSPEWTEADFARARPLREALATARETGAGRAPRPSSGNYRDKANGVEPPEK